MRFQLLVSLSLLAACGSDPPLARIVLSDRYTAVGVVRVLPDGVTAQSLTTFELDYRDLVTSGGALRGKLEVAARGLVLDLSGEIDGATGNFTFTPPPPAALTSTAVETIEQLGGTGFDLTPKDGIAEDISGFVRARVGTELHQGFYVASPIIAGAPASVDPVALHARVIGLGRAEIVGDRGAVNASAGLELLVYYLAPGDPRFSSAIPMSDGSFRAEVEALEGDVVIVRPRVAGVPGPGIAIRVSAS